MHPTQPKKTDRTHSRMLPTNSAQCALRRADGGADFRKVQRRIRPFDEQFLKPRQQKTMTPIGRAGLAAPSTKQERIAWIKPCSIARTTSGHARR
jgi:hypothetical protein